MNVIQPEPKQGLNSIFGDLISNIFSPQGNNDNTEQLNNQLYLTNQELARTKKTNTYTMVAAGIFGLSTIYLGYKQFKN